MVEKRIQNTAIDISPNANNSLEVEGVGEEIQLQEPENTNKGYDFKGLIFGFTFCIFN